MHKTSVKKHLKSISTNFLNFNTEYSKSINFLPKKFIVNRNWHFSSTKHLTIFFK